jgi:hypothetical protein
LYERIAKRLEKLDYPVAYRAVEGLERLLAEPPPFRDYGPAAKERNARIESILVDLEVDRADTVMDQNHAFREGDVDGRADAFAVDRRQRAEK